MYNDYLYWHLDVKGSIRDAQGDTKDRSEDARRYLKGLTGRPAASAIRGFHCHFSNFTNLQNYE